jgi:hypothetical protein
MRLTWNAMALHSRRMHTYAYDGLANGVNHWDNLTFRVGEKVHYTCPGEPRRLIGSQIRTCQMNSRWTGRLPTCGNLLKLIEDNVN